MKTYSLLLITLLLIPIAAMATDPYEGYVAPSLNGTAPFTVNFTDISYGQPTFYNWTYRDVTGDNVETSFSNDPSPYYTFTEAGNYSIQLYVSNADGTNTSPSSFVNITSLLPPSVTAPTAGFTVNKYTVVFPWIIVINSTTTGTDPITYAYSFGDGTANLTTANGTHQYSKRGVFPLNLWASNSAGGSQASANIRVVGYQGLMALGGVVDQCTFSSSRELDKFEYARVNCQLCGVCE